MSSRSNGVTNVRLRRSTTSRVRQCPSCSSSLISLRFVPFDGNASRSWTRWREITTALADACSRSRKNCLFCGTARFDPQRSSPEVTAGVCQASCYAGCEASVNSRNSPSGGRRSARRFDGVVADALEGPGDHHHAQAVLPHLGSPPSSRMRSTTRRFARSMSSSRSTRTRRLPGPCHANEPSATRIISSAASAHLLEPFDEARAADPPPGRASRASRSSRSSRPCARGGGDVEIARTSRRSLATGVCRASSGYALFDPNVALVDVVVECDDLVSELLVTLLECLDRAAQCRSTS